MSKITTQDCKKFLVDSQHVLENAKLKRLKKYKDNDNLYIREFSDESGKVYLVKELSDGSLALHNGMPKENTNKEVVEKKTFDGKKFIKNLIKKMENDDDGDLIENTTEEIFILSDNDKKEIAQQFYFCFPDDTYNNDINSLTSGMNTLMLNNGDSYCIFFYDKFNSEPDMGLTDILISILPGYFNKCDESNFEISTYEHSDKEIIEALTIQDIVDLLEDIGFVYKNENSLNVNEEECMLHKLKLKKNPKLK